MKSSWTYLAERYHLSDQILTALQHYVKILQQESQKYNLTTIQEEGDVIAYHLADALEVEKIIDMHAVSSFVDVGSGAGIPGLVLKIAYPSCSAILLEVLSKRRTFLQLVVDELQLSQVTIDERDWRTFLRTSHEKVQLVCARASLASAELLRMFQPSSPYRHAQLVYWASAQWQPTPREQEFLIKTHTYTVGDRTRVLAVFGEKNNKEESNV
jgi:16S rRNA (guanine(527)-N(7))-methyltransferase RsmG